MNIRAFLIKPVLALALALGLLLLAPRLAPQPAGAVPANDNLANAIAVTTPARSGIVAVGDNTGATLEGSETQCTGAMGATIWYNWTSPAGTGTVVFDTYGSSFDTILGIYTGSSFPLTNAGCNDDFGSFRSGVALTYAPSTTYRIQIAGFGGATGSVVLNMSLGADIVVDTTADNTTSDSVLTLREAMQLAVGGTSVTGLNRALDGSGETQQVLNAGAAGASGSDLVHFSPATFPPGAPVFLTLIGTLPYLTTNNDIISGIGAGVKIDAVIKTFWCFNVLGNGNVIEGLSISNCSDAIHVLGANNIIGGATIPGQRNLIYLNDGGVELLFPGASGNLVIGNYMGTNASGTAAGPGNAVGVGISNGAHDNTIGGSAPGQGNLISGNNDDGVLITDPSSNGNSVIGNYIGTNAAGTAVGLGNAVGVGISNGAHNNTVGGSAPGQGNLISGNTIVGVLITDPSSNGNSVIGNMVGTDVSGLSALRNFNGVTIANGAQGNIIGGSSPGQGNLISGNTGAGVSLQGSGTSFNTIRGNKIGLDITGNAPLANSGHGVFSVGASQNVVGGSAAGEGNVISGNISYGIWLSSASNSNTVYGNKIGTNAAGTAGVPNLFTGIRITVGTNNLIGGVGAGQGNVIAYNPTGVEVASSGAMANPVRGNSIYANTTMGIDNTAGGNLELPPPAVTAVAGLNINGIACPLCTVDVYNDVGSQGRLYIGTTTANGVGLFTLTGASHPLPNLTAIAMDAAGNTSEFSAAFAAPIDSDGDGIANSSDACPTQPEDFDGFQDGDGCPDPDNDGDGICDPGLTALSCHGSDQGYLCFDPASPATLSCPLTDCRNMAEDYDAFHDGDGCPEPDNDNDGHPDVSDACPGTDSQTGLDNMLGSPQDKNHNGIQDGAETPLTTDDVSPYVFEDWDGVLDGDGCHDSPGDDFDGDSFGAMRAGFPLFDDDREVFMGTDAGHYCAATPTANDEPAPDAWPFDFNDDQKATINDILLFIPVFNTTGPNPPYSARFDYTQDNKITINDILLFIPVFNQSCLR